LQKTLTEIKRGLRNFFEIGLTSYQFAWEEWTKKSDKMGMTIVELEKNCMVLDLMKWCSEKTVGEWTYFNVNYFSFVEKQDAVMFKLKWG
jgi:hypothetical protein